MGKVRHVILGDEDAEKEAKKKAEARRQAKAAKKAQDKAADEPKADAEQAETAAPEAKSSKKPKEVKARVRSKRYQEMAGMVERTKLYPLSEAIELVKKTSMTKFDGTVELHVNLNPATLGDKKDFRTGVSLPHSTGKQVRVVIADDKVIADVQEGKINFDVLVAHPSMMAKLAKVARVLGPRGLMPNPKTGTVTPEPEKRAQELSNGQVNIKTEPGNPIIHMGIGKVSSADSDIAENVQAVLAALGNKVAKVSLSATMSPGVKVALS